MHKRLKNKTRRKNGNKHSKNAFDCIYISALLPKEWKRLHTRPAFLVDHENINKKHFHINLCKSNGPIESIYGKRQSFANQTRRSKEDAYLISCPTPHPTKI
jgi:hypothetical protein